MFAPDHVVAIYLPLLIEYQGGPSPQSWRVLSIAPCDHILRRTGPRTLELETEPGRAMMGGVFESLYRSRHQPLEVGTALDRGLLQAEILDVDEQGPTRVAFHFDRDLTDPSLRFLVWQEGKLQEMTLPGVGEVVGIERSLGPGGF